MKYTVRVTDTLVKDVKVEAASEKEAREKVERMWFNCELNLVDPDNLIDHETYALKPEPKLK